LALCPTRVKQVALAMEHLECTQLPLRVLPFCSRCCGST
jgi:hypothetical protein